MEEDENTPVTRRELAHILKGKGEASEPTWEISPPFGHHILAKPYPKGYQPPTFRKFDGTGSAKEHILSFLDDLGVFRNHQELKIKEFSKSLTGRVFTWYCKLKASSINTWEQLVTEFCNKFLEEEPSMHIMDLGRVKQRQGEGLVTFVKRYRDQALLCIDTLPEPQLVYGCIRNMEDGSQIYLSMSNINTFFELLKRASDITEAMKRNGRRYKEVSPLEEVMLTEIVDEAEEMVTMEESLDEDTLTRGLLKSRVVEGMKVRRALVDAGSGVNIIPTHIFLEMGGSTDQIRPTQVGLNAFNGVGVKSRGYVNAVLEVGPIKTNNKFHVVDGSSSYHILLGRPWIHLHRCVPSSWHQCIKSSWRGKDISISATVTPFDAGEAHLVDASFYEELALPGVNKIRPVQECTIGTPRQKAIRKDTLMEEAPKENTKKRATSIEDLGLRKEILPGGGYRWCIL
ncbi:hypothetical protein AHAS_Ahas13G0420300 [Arachis hypogaea]